MKLTAFSIDTVTDMHQYVEDGEQLDEFYTMYESLPAGHMDLATRWNDLSQTLLYRYTDTSHLCAYSTTKCDLWHISAALTALFQFNFIHTCISGMPYGILHTVCTCKDV